MLDNLPKRVLGLILCCLWASGCWFAAASVGAGAGVAGYKWLEGTMIKDYPYPYPYTWEATLVTVEQLRLKTVERKHDPLSGKIEATQADGTLVQIEVVAKPDDITRVGVRFGYLGDRDASVIFHNRLQQELRM
ncbi:MAG: DUF3568 family protein [Desulfobacteraceae bacterium]